MTNKPTKISWQTPSSKTVTLTHVTERTNLADHNYTYKTDDIDLHVDGAMMIITSHNLTDNPTYGPMIQAMGAKVYVSPDKLDKVKAMLNDHYNRRIARQSAVDKAEHEYQSHYSSVERMRTTGRA